MSLLDDDTYKRPYAEVLLDSDMYERPDAEVLPLITPAAANTMDYVRRI